MTRAGRIAGCGMVLAAVVAGGCKRGGDDDRASGPPVQIDSANNQPMDGVSDEQLKQQAQALTPEQAAAAGMVDTTTHIEDLGGQDSTPAGAANNDTATKAAGATTGTPPASATKP
ncbi:hypothetical protein [Longimicrobium sp.]|uniref:hypothetical protein n=1 Tax=Longimicrobium sp. TaxID=2029185 RepID=UPI002CC8BE8F|nr:hypothetical protein [Longimicrobium sp.]HSU14650.1 hypothetical protein [Longimicrobium sp.]